MIKKVLFSVKRDHEIIESVFEILRNSEDIKFIFHDPTQDLLDLERINDIYGDFDYFIVKVGSECSLDLLHFAKINKIPCLHDIDTVLMCKNKVALDIVLRNTLRKYKDKLDSFLIPKSWTQTLMDLKNFSEWAISRLPIVIKSHYQHDKFNRFNFLMRKIEEIDEFVKLYANFLYYDVYIQEFIECDGIERKIYVIDDKVFGVKRENPIYVFLRDQPKSIDVDMLDRERFEISKEIKNLAMILSRELGLKIFGFDLVKANRDNKYYLIDLNDFPGFRGIENIDSVITQFLLDYIKELK